MHTPMSEEFTEEELYAKLDYFLSNYGTDNSLFCVSELDGFFTAIGCAKATISPDVWLPAIWGSDEDQPIWETPEQAEEFAGLVLLMYVETIETLLKGDLHPIFLENDLDDSTDLVVDEWCTGFMRGALLSGLTLQDDKVFIDEVMAPMRLFGSEKGWKKMASMTYEEIQFWKDILIACVLRLASHNHPEIELLPETIPPSMIH